LVGIKNICISISKNVIVKISLSLEGNIKKILIYWLRYSNSITLHTFTGSDLPNMRLIEVYKVILLILSLSTYILCHMIITQKLFTR